MSYSEMRSTARTTSRSSSKAKKSTSGKDVFLLIVGVVGMASLFLLCSARFGFSPATQLVDSIAGQKPASTARYQNANIPTSGDAVVYVTDMRTINISDQGTKHYVKVQMGLEYSTPASLDNEDNSAAAYKKKEQELRTRMGERSAVIYDQMVTTMSTKTSKELLSAEGQESLKRELKGKFAKILDDRDLLDIFFLDFVVG